MKPTKFSKIHFSASQRGPVARRGLMSWALGWGLAGALLAPAAWAQTAPAAAANVSASVADSPHKAEAEVRRVEAATGRIQLKHGPIPSLDMPPMTMVFRVQNPALLEGLKEGDLIWFTAERINGAYTVTGVQRRP